MSDTEKFDPSRRRLCPDGSCVGLLDETGRCKECGRTASGAAEEPVGAPAFDDSEDVGFAVSDDADQGQAADDPQGRAADDPQLAASGGFDPKRKLCPDGACVGVIGADGRCSVCGQAG
jgi:hypothetical protein